MKKIRVIIEPPFGGTIVEYFDVDDDASDADIAAEAEIVFSNHCSYGWSVVEEGDDHD